MRPSRPTVTGLFTAVIDRASPEWTWFVLCIEEIEMINMKGGSYISTDIVAFNVEQNDKHGVSVVY